MNSPTGSVVERFTTDGVVPLLGGDSVSFLIGAAQAVVESGLSTLEITLRSPNTIDVFAGLSAWVEQNDVPLEIGVGTVLTSKIAKAAVSLGARFVFSPVLSSEVAATCEETGTPYFPGCATPTEIHQAMELGCNTVKLFPASTLGGPTFLRSVRAVFPGLSPIPTGGITPDRSELAAWFAAGACAVGLGSSLFGGIPSTNDWGAVERRLRSTVAAVAAAREEVGT